MAPRRRLVSFHEHTDFMMTLIYAFSVAVQNMSLTRDEQAMDPGITFTAVIIDGILIAAAILAYVCTH